MSSITQTRHNASSASEWLSTAAPQLENAPDTHRVDQLVAVAFLAASLERQAIVTTPSASTLAVLQEALARVPVQLVHVPPQHAAHDWLQLSALAEFLGEPALARIIINALAAHLGEHAPARGARRNTSTDDSATSVDPLQRELLALCWTRRGRMSRVAGALEDAEACFQEALALVSEEPWRDARSAAELGLINLAVARGNYPRVEQLCTALLNRTNAALAPVHVAATFQMRAIARRKRQQWLEALLDSWSAYDQLGQASAHRAELVISMAETALEVGDLCAAMAGFGNAHREALATGAQFRVQAAAITGLARTINRCLLSPKPVGSALAEHQVQHAGQSLAALLDAPLAPRERVYALVTMAEWRLREQDQSSARTVLTEARTLALAHGYFDYQFRIDTLLDQLNASLPDSAPSAPRVAVWQNDTRHPALVRLASLV